MCRRGKPCMTEGQQVTDKVSIHVKKRKGYVRERARTCKRGEAHARNCMRRKVQERESM